MSRSVPLFTPFAKAAESFTINPELAAAAGLAAWADQFKLGTAGYRDLLDPDDLFNFDVPFNGLTAAVMLEARARLAVENGLQTLHIGGEVRPHTQEFIDLAARLYAAHGIEVHLRPVGERTTPIWLSSFGVFFEELEIPLKIVATDYWTSEEIVLEKGDLDRAEAQLGAIDERGGEALPGRLSDADSLKLLYQGGH